MSSALLVIAIKLSVKPLSNNNPDSSLLNSCLTLKQYVSFPFPSPSFLSPLPSPRVPYHTSPTCPSAAMGTEQPADVRQGQQLPAGIRMWQTPWQRPSLQHGLRWTGWRLPSLHTPGSPLPPLHWLLLAALPTTAGQLAFGCSGFMGSFHEVASSLN